MEIIYIFLSKNLIIWKKSSNFALGFGWVAQRYVVSLKIQRLMSQQMLKRLGGTNCGKPERRASNVLMPLKSWNLYRAPIGAVVSWEHTKN